MFVDYLNQSKVKAALGPDSKSPTRVQKQPTSAMNTSFKKINTSTRIARPMTATVPAKKPSKSVSPIKSVKPAAKAASGIQVHSKA